VEYCSSCHRVIRDSANIKWVLGRPYGSKCGIYVPSSSYYNIFLHNCQDHFSFSLFSSELISISSCQGIDGSFLCAALNL